MSDNQENMNLGHGEVSPSPATEVTDEAMEISTGNIADGTTDEDTVSTAAVSPDADGAAVATVPAKPSRHPLGWLFDFVEILAFALSAALLIFAFGWRICQVDGDSMLNTLRDKGMLIVTSLAEPEAGDIIVFHNISDNATYTNRLVKRVIATGGQTVRIDYGAQTVSVDGVVIDEPYVALLGYGSNGSYLPSDRMEPYGSVYMSQDGLVFEATVPEGHYFVMGDNRNHSADSRYPFIGFVDERCVLGTLAFRISPFATADELNGQNGG